MEKWQSDIEQSAYELIQVDWTLPDFQSKWSEQELLAILARAIEQLLNRDFEKLLQLCYRIDLGEEKLRKILHESEPDQISMDLAKALWERQKQKAEIRRRYS